MVFEAYVLRKLFWLKIIQIYSSLSVIQINYQTINMIWVLVTTFCRENAKNHHKMPFWDCFRKSLLWEWSQNK